MASTSGNFSFAAYNPATVSANPVDGYREIYEANRYRIYALSFWMTDNELAAEELMRLTFCRAFSVCDHPSPDAIDRALITELRQFIPLGALSLDCATCTEVAGVRRNVLRVHLERAIVQVPPTERLVFLMHDVESYSHERIAFLLGLTANECRQALHQARLRIRELLAAMIS